MQFFYFKNRMYDLLGWTTILEATTNYLLDKFCELEQTYHYHSKKKVNWETQAYWFHISDKDLGEFTNIKSRTTLGKHINILLENNLIKVKSDRSKNRIGTATEYIIVKPIPFPKEEVKISKVIETRYGRYYLDQIIENHKILLEKENAQNLETETESAQEMSAQEMSAQEMSAQEMSAQNLSAQNLNALLQENDKGAHRICAPRIDVEIDRKKERKMNEGLVSEIEPQEQSTQETQSEKTFSEKKDLSRPFSEKELQVISLSERYLPNANIVVKPFLKDLEKNKLDIILSILETNKQNGFDPQSGPAFILSLLTDDSYLDKMAAASVNLLNKGKGFAKPSPYEKPQKETRAKKKAGLATPRSFYDEIFGKSLNQEEDSKKVVQVISDADLPF